MVRISVVSFLNSLPFYYGIQHSGFLKNKIILEEDIPSVCASKLKNDKVDLGLVPITIMNEIKDYRIVTDYCLGAKGRVMTVILVSEKPLHEIKSIYLDYHSNTSVTLVRVLAKHFWHISPHWVKGSVGYEAKIKKNKAGIIIGDRCFYFHNRFPYVYDLSEEWLNFTGLPFVFACWISNKPLEKNFIIDFEKALRFGLGSIEEIAEKYGSSHPDIDIREYLQKNLSYILDEEKKKAIRVFLEYSKSI